MAGDRRGHSETRKSTCCVRGARGVASPSEKPSERPIEKPARESMRPRSLLTIRPAEHGLIAARPTCRRKGETDIGEHRGRINQRAFPTSRRPERYAATDIGASQEQQLALRSRPIMNVATRSRSDRATALARRNTSRRIEAAGASCPAGHVSRMTRSLPAS